MSFRRGLAALAVIAAFAVGSSLATKDVALGVEGCCGGGGGHEAGHGSDSVPQEEGKTAVAEGGHSGHGGGGSTSSTSSGTGLLVDLANEKCPIMGGKPDGKTFSEWSGLRVGHCCGMCPGKFQADPAKALDKAGIDWKPAAAAVKKVADAKTPEDRSKALKAVASKWKVVREPAPEPAPESKDAPTK